MSVWSGIAGTLGKVFSTAAPIMGMIPGVGAIPSTIASAAGGFLNQMASEEKQKDLYNQQLAYNSPKEQMARLKEAGLNPNLIYGSQGVTGMSANEATAPNLEQYKENPVLKMSPKEIFDMSMQRQQQNNNNRVADSQVKANEAKANEADAHADWYRSDKTRVDNYNSMFDVVRDDAQASLDYKKLRNVAQQIDNDILSNKRDLSSEQLKSYKQSWPLEIQKVQEQVNNLRKQGKQIDASIAREYAEISLIPLKADLLRAQKGEADARTQHTLKSLGLIDDQHNINNARLNEINANCAKQVMETYSLANKASDVSGMASILNPIIRAYTGEDNQRMASDIMYMYGVKGAQ